MDIMDDFKKEKTYLYRCPEEGCNNTHTFTQGLFMVCKRHGQNKPRMIYSGQLRERTEFNPEDYLKPHEQDKLVKLMNKRFTRMIDNNEYLQKLSEFWKSVGEHAYAEEVLFEID
tara:strand:- start:12374 stop:12718 length:345 start_codon:yes stop_codon:yes gene_type:complete